MTHCLIVKCAVFLFFVQIFCIPVTSALAGDAGAFIPGKGWVVPKTACDGDSTPLQFVPKTPPDASPLSHEFEKYPRCVHCGMSRTMWHHSRYLVQYDDDLVVGTCSLHCLAVNLSLNLDRGIKKIYVGDFSDTGKPAGVIDADAAFFLIGSDLKGTMTMNSKMAFATKEAAEAAQKAHGGTIAGFDAALKQAYGDMAADTLMIRKRRAKKAAHMKHP